MMTKKLLFVTALTSAVALQAGATGYEQSIEWSGRYSSVGGIGTTATGAEALYFNPAGLARGTVGSEISFNLSPQRPVSKGPITADNESLTSETTTVMPGSLMYNYNLTPDLGFGIGWYVGGGAIATFDNVQYTGFTSYTKTKNEVVDNEIALGVGYQVIPGLKIGAAVRAMFINAEVAGAAVKTGIPGGGSMLVYTDHSGLSDREIGGLRLGAEYSPSKDWGLGLTYRSKVDFFAHGTTQATYEVKGNAIHNGVNAFGPMTTDSSTTVSSTFPEQWTLGGFYNITDTWHVLAAAEVAKYSENPRINISGNLTIAAAGISSPIGSIPESFSDQYTYRLGAEYVGFDWPIRFGVIYQTISENSTDTNAAFFAPGNNMTVTVGTGHKVMDNMTLDAGLAYSTDKKSVNNGGDATLAKSGDYSSTDLALHAGLTYMF